MKREERGSHDWLSLVELSGLVVTEPVLDEHFPDGPPEIDQGARHWFSRRAERFRIAHGDYLSRSRRGEDPRKAREAAGAWIDFVLEEFLEHLADDPWLKGARIPERCRTRIQGSEHELRPDRVLVHRGEPTLYVALARPDQGLDERDREVGRWKVTPTARFERLLRDTGQPVGLLTNGSDWRIVHCSPGVSTGTLTWTTRLLFEEPSALRSFRMLLGRDLLRPADPNAATLASLCRQSLERQADVADQLGVQARSALEHLLHAVDNADRKSGGTLLAGMGEDEVYEMLLVLTMRLVFLLYAEEHRLLPHGDAFYDRSYGVAHLWRELRDRLATLDEDCDAWERLLATFQLVHGGCEHADLSLRAYGGALFDPQRFPALRTGACRIPNRTIERVLDQLLFARAHKGGERQRVGYWSLDVEEIGYLYEGLLDHRVARAAGEPLVKLARAKDPREADRAWPLAELESRDGDARLDWVLEQTGHKTTAAERAKLGRRAAEEPGDADRTAVARLPVELAARVRPLAGFVRCTEVVQPGHRYLTTGTSRRASGAHYTPQSLTERVVRTTLEPLVYRCEEGKPGAYVLESGQRVLRAPRELLELQVADIAAGSGAFLVQVVRYLSERLVEAWQRADDAAPEGVTLVAPYAEESREPGRELPLPFQDADELRLWARRYVASRCVYGVDVNPLAVEMTRLSLWIVTSSRDKPFSFLDHAIRCGDSLLGVDRRQLERGSLDAESGQAVLGADEVSKPLKEALEIRARIRSAPVFAVEDQAAKEKALEDAEHATELVRLAGDVLIAPFLAEEKARDREKLGEILFVLLADARRSGDFGPLKLRVQEALAGRHPFHWFAELPEVFERGGFDAIVGNPPYLGGQHLTGAYGVPYREYLVETIGRKKRGSADYVSYFFLRAGELVRLGGHYGLLATNTVAQGDTRENGLEQLLASGHRIHAATKSMKWPGEASLEISVVHGVHGPWVPKPLLEGLEVARISPLLDAGPMEKPYRLKVNEGLSYQGSNILGPGFTMPPEEARAWIERDPRNAEVLQPYLNGEDLNSNPAQEPSRWVINFRDWPLEKCEEWPELLDIVRRKVKPERDENKRPVRKRYWWRFAEVAPNLYRAIAPLERVIARAEVSKHHAFGLLPARQVFSHMLIVFPSQDMGFFASVQSVIHECWAHSFASTMRMDLRYTPSDCFDTFPLPESVDPLRRAGLRYVDCRQQVMLDAHEGLAWVVKRNHDRDATSAQIEELRRLGVSLDLAVRDAYGWTDLDLEHGWYSTTTSEERRGRRVEKTTWRFTISERARREILRRLLALNHARYAEEVARGLHDKGKRPKSGTARPPKAEVVAEGPGLYDSEPAG